MNSVVNIVIILSASVFGACMINFILNTIGIKYKNKKNPEEYPQEDKTAVEFSENKLEPPHSLEGINNPVNPE